MSELANAIKVAIQATKESEKNNTISHTALLNNVAKKLGFKNFRALVASDQKPEASKTETDTPRSFDFEPFTLYCYTSDDVTSVASHEIDSESFPRLFEFSAAAKKLRTQVPQTDWQEDAVAPGTCMATRLLMSPGGEISIEAEIYDKHWCTNVSTYGQVALDTLYALVSGVNQKNIPAVALDYIWDESERAFYMIDMVEPECWIDASTPSIEALLKEYEELESSDNNEEA